MKLKTSYTCSAWLTRMSELSWFVYIINHVTLHVKSNAKKVNFLPYSHQKNIQKIDSYGNHTRK